MLYSSVINGINYGIQDTVFGITLFNVYGNELFSLNSYGKTFGFADNYIKQVW